MSGIWSAVAIGGSSVIGGGLSYLGGTNQARAQKNAAQSEEEMLNQIIQQFQIGTGKAAPLLAPYQEAGAKAESGLAALTAPGMMRSATDMTNFRADPQYQAIMKSAMSAVQNSAAGRGGLYSGQTGQDLETAAASIADKAYQQIYSNKMGAYQTEVGNLSGIAGGGMTASIDMAGLFTGEFANIAQSMGQIGNARSSGITGAAAAGGMGLSGINTAVQGGVGLGLNQYQANQNSQNYQQLIAALMNKNNSSVAPTGPGPWASGYVN